MDTKNQVTLSAGTEEACYVCPGCGSTSVDFGELVGAAASCRICGWQGTKDELVSAPFAHTGLSKESIAQELVNDMRKLLSEPTFTKGFAQFLLRWGFIPRDISHKETVRLLCLYGNTLARSMMAGVTSAREAEERRVHDQG